MISFKNVFADNICTETLQFKDRTVFLVELRWQEVPGKLCLERLCFCEVLLVSERQGFGLQERNFKSKNLRLGWYSFFFLSFRFYTDLKFPLGLLFLNPPKVVVPLLTSYNSILINIVFLGHTLISEQRKADSIRGLTFPRRLLLFFFFF